MASAIYTASQLQQPSYRQEAMIKRVAEPGKGEVIIVPTLVDLQTPVRNVMNALQWRRRLRDFVSGHIDGFVSGAVALR